MFRLFSVCVCGLGVQMLVTEEGVELLTARPGETTMQWDPERFSR